MLRGLFARGGPGAASFAGQAAQVKDWARSVMGEEAVFMVSEIDCGDPACPGLETVILVLRPGRPTRAAKVSKPMAEVTEPDIRSCLAELDSRDPEP